MSCKTSQGVIQKVRLLRRGVGESLKSKQKRTGGGVSEHVCKLAFLKNNAEIFKMRFYSYSPIFPIDYNGSMKY